MGVPGRMGGRIPIHAAWLHEAPTQGLYIPVDLWYIVGTSLVHLCTHCCLLILSLANIEDSPKLRPDIAAPIVEDRAEGQTLLQTLRWRPWSRHVWVVRRLRRLRRQRTWIWMRQLLGSNRQQGPELWTQTAQQSPQSVLWRGPLKPQALRCPGALGGSRSAGVAPDENCATAQAKLILGPCGVKVIGPNA